MPALASDVVKPLLDELERLKEVEEYASRAIASMRVAYKAIKPVGAEKHTGEDGVMSECKCVLCQVATRILLDKVKGKVPLAAFESERLLDRLAAAERFLRKLTSPKLESKQDIAWGELEPELSEFEKAFTPSSASAPADS